MSDDKSFKYTYRAPTDEERREIESIRREYTENNGEPNELEELKTLDKKVKTLPKIAGITLGIAGTLTFGGGMALVMSYRQMLWGVIVSVAGAVVAGAAYFVYNAILRRNKKKYGKRILELTDRLLGDKQK